MIWSNEALGPGGGIRVGRERGPCTESLRDIRISGDRRRTQDGKVTGTKRDTRIRPKEKPKAWVSSITRERAEGKSHQIDLTHFGLREQGRPMSRGHAPENVGGGGKGSNAKVPGGE